MSVKAYEMVKHCTTVYNTIRKDFTTLERYHGCNYFIFVTMIAVEIQHLHFVAAKLS